MNVYESCEEFVVFFDNNNLVVYNDFNNENLSSFKVNLLDSLKNSNNSVDLNNRNVTSLSISKLSKLEYNLLKNISNLLTSKDKTQEYNYLLTVSVNGFILLYLYSSNNNGNSNNLPLYNVYNLKEKIISSADKKRCGQWDDETEIRNMNTLIINNDTCSFYLIDGDLFMLNWNKHKINILFTNIILYKFYNDNLILFNRNGILNYNLNNFDLTKLEPKSQLEVKIENLNKNNVTIIEKSNILLMLLNNGLYYVLLDKFKLYKFGENLVVDTNDNSTLLTNKLVNELNVVVLLNGSNLMLLDYDTQNALFKHKLSVKCNFCLLTNSNDGVVKLHLFRDHEFVGSLKLLVEDERFLLTKSYDDSSKEERRNSVSPNNKETDDKRPQLERRRSVLENEDEDDVKYRKLKKIKKNKFLDLESVDVDDTTASSIENSNVNNNNVEHDNSLDNTSNNAFDNNRMSDNDDDDFLNNIDNYYNINATNDYNYGNNMDLVGELIKMKKKLNLLESKLTGRSSRAEVVLPGLCPKPNDQYKQWILFWNEYGHVSKQNNLENNNLHIYLFNGPLSGYIKKLDKYNCNLCSLCTDGIVCSTNLYSNSSSSENSPQENSKSEGNKFSILYYINLMTNANWERRFKNEFITCLTISNNFIGVATDLNVLYIFTRNNVLLTAFKLKGQVRSMVSNRNFLMVMSELSRNVNLTTSSSSSEHHVSGTNGGKWAGVNVVLNVKVLWVNGLKGLTKNTNLKAVSLYDDLLTLNNCDLKHVGITSNFVLWYIDTQGQLWLLMNCLASLSGLDKLEWLPTVNIYNLNKSIYPLYVNNLQLCYVKLKGNSTYPESNNNINFFGYTLSRLNLRVDGVSNYYFNYNMYNNTLLNNPLLKDVSTVNLTANNKLGADKLTNKDKDDVERIPWQQYDDMRYVLNLNIDYNQFLVRLIKQYNYWYITSNTGHHFSGGMNASDSDVNELVGNINLCEKNHDKWLLRILRKAQLSKEFHVNNDVIQMMRMPKCLEIAKTITQDDKQRKLIDESLMLLEKFSQFNTVNSSK